MSSKNIVIELFSELKSERRVFQMARAYLHSVIRFHVLARDERRCTHVFADGQRCSATHGLEIHHIIEVSKGGTDEVENLATLCSVHHQQCHPDFQISSQIPNRQRNRFGYWVKEETVEYIA